MADAPQAPAGWYPDPRTPGAQRYWDGSAWTTHTAPIGAPPARPTGFWPAYSRSDRSAPEVLWWQRTWVLVLSILLCLPLGLVIVWMRPGLTTKARTWLTAGAVVWTLLLMGVSSGSGGSVDAEAPAPTPAAKTPQSVPSAHPVLIAVPRVVGLSQASARRSLNRAGLVLGQVTHQPSPRPRGTVLRQAEAAGSQDAPGSVVDIVVASPLPRVPDVRGLAAAAATRRLRAAGFVVEAARQVVTSGTTGVVLSQAPAAGTAVRPGHQVHLAIALVRKPPPPPPTRVPLVSPVHSCTTTSSGTCIQGGEFCPQASYGTTGYDGDGTAYVCTGDHTHPHWE